MPVVVIFDAEGALVGSADVHARAWQDAFRDQIGKGVDQLMPAFLSQADNEAFGDELETYKRIAGIAGLVHEQTSSDDAEKGKTHPDIFLAALERLDHSSPGDVAVVGVTPYDAEAAGRAGLRTVGVLCGGFSEQNLYDAGCIAICRDPADLPAQLEQSPLTQESSS